MADSCLVLVVNCGSSSVKFTLIDPETGNRSMTGLGQRIGTPSAEVRVERGEARSVGASPDHSYAGVITHLLGLLTEAERAAVVGAGHRVVHGGSRFAESVLIDDSVLAELRDLVDLAPLHMPANLTGISTVQAGLPQLAQVAVFDTAFHQTMPPVAYRYAVPTDWYVSHAVRRYGFHGTSHRYVSGRAAQVLGRPIESLRMVSLHLGNGCSAAAIRDGRSVDTTMGLTPLEGLVMGTRSGDVDPGLLGYISGRLDLDLAGVLDQLNGSSGLLGLSGLSNDLRTVEEQAARGNEACQLAIDVFAYRAAKAVAASVVPLGRLDAVVFTGGIGERSSVVRSAIVGHLGALNIHIDAQANAKHGQSTDGRLTVPGGVEVLVVPTDEELLIARDTRLLAT